MKIRFKKTMQLIGLILIALILTNCKSHIETKEISDEIVLKIGSIEITRYEFERNKGRYYNPESKNYKEWVESFIDEIYFLAGAYDLRYDTVQEINKQVTYASTGMVSKIDGYLWKHRETPKLVFSNSETRQIYSKRDKIFYIEYLLFPDKETLVGILGSDTLIKTEYDFVMASNKARSNSKVNYVNQAIIFPFNDLYEVRDVLYEMEAGNVSPLLYLPEAIIIAHITKIEATKRLPYKKMKEDIQYELSLIKTREIIREKQKEVFCKANIEINDEVGNTVFMEIINQPTDSLNIYDTIMLYSLNNKKHIVTAGDFLEYYKMSPMVGSNIETKEQLLGILNNIVLEQYMCFEADSMGVLNSKEYKLDGKNYKNRVLINYYLVNEIINKVKVTDQDMKDYYLQNCQNKTEAETCYISLYTFKNVESAAGSFETLNTKLNNGELVDLSDSTLFNGLSAFEDSVEININNTAYPVDFIRKVFSSKVNVLSKPITMNETGILFLKIKEKGERIKTFEDQKEEITNIVQEISYNTIRNKKLKDLKAKHAIEINKIQ